MRELQLQLQRQAQAGGMADWAADEPAPPAADDGWALAGSRRQQRAAAAASTRGAPAGGQGTAAPSAALWIGSIDQGVEPADLARAMNGCGGRWWGGRDWSSPAAGAAGTRLGDWPVPH